MSKTTAKKKEKEDSKEKSMKQKKRESKPTSMIEEDTNPLPDPFKMINSKKRSESKPTSKKLVKSNENVNLVEDDVIGDWGLGPIPNPQSPISI